MARLRAYGNVVAYPGGRSFYTAPSKHTRRARAPVTPALRSALAKQRKERRAQYQSALHNARDTVRQQATQLRETFGGHAVEYYTQEILQRGRLERGRRKPSRWNAFLRQELKLRNAGAHILITLCVAGPKTELPELPTGQPKLKSTDIVREASEKWKQMNLEAQAEATDSAMGELIASREEIDKGAKVAPVHVFNDVSATMTKIKHEVNPQNETNNMECFIDIPFQ